MALELVPSIFGGTDAPMIQFLSQLVVGGSILHVLLQCFHLLEPVVVLEVVLHCLEVWFYLQLVFGLDVSVVK